MARRIGAGELLAVASHNSGKVVEIQALLKPFGVATVGAAALGLPEPEETGATFEENAALKAREASARKDLPRIHQPRRRHHAVAVGIRVVTDGEVVAIREGNQPGHRVR